MTHSKHSKQAKHAGVRRDSRSLKRALPHPSRLNRLTQLICLFDQRTASTAATIALATRAYASTCASTVVSGPCRGCAQVAPVACAGRSELPSFDAVAPVEAPASRVQVRVPQHDHHRRA